MRFRPWRESGLAAKLLVSFVLLSLLPIGVMSVLSLRHLETIQQVSAKETRAAVISAQISRLRERLGLEAGRLSATFGRLQDEAHGLRAFAESLLAEPTRFSYRNGSRYELYADGSYGNRFDDGRSVLFVPRYRPSLDPLVAATESLDLVLKPLAEREPRMVFAWIILRKGITRGYPWRDFGHMPVDKDYTSWPFYYLADPAHNPKHRELFTDVYLDPLSGAWMISCLSPVYVGGAHEATVGIDITIHTLLAEIRNLRPSDQASSFLLSGTSIIAASDNLPAQAMGLDPAKPFHGQDLAASLRPEVRELASEIQGKQATVGFSETPGLKAFAAWASVEPPGWKIVLLVPEAEVVAAAQKSASQVLSESQRIRSNFIHILIFALVGILTITWLVFAHQSRGLRTLLTGIQRLGQGELGHRLEAGEGEFGQLAQALNSMAEGLQEKKRDLEKAYAEVEEERKLSAVGRLAAGVAHEVNNPLATISTYTQMMLRRKGIEGDARGDLQVVMEEVRRIQEKLRNLLDLSRLQSPVRTLLCPDVLVRDVADLARHEAAAKGISLDLSLEAGDARLRIDRSGVKQVLWNLLGNAIAAQEEGGSVSVRTRIASLDGAGPAFVLEVEDEGPGIPESLLPKIFEPFFTTKEVGQGTGLGLAVVYRIVRGHDGKIEVENRIPRGCCFRIVLPVGEEA